MKAIFLILIFSLSLYSLTLEESKHLLNRTSFGYTKADLKQFSKFTKEEAVNFLINQGKSTDILAMPLDIKEVSLINKKFKDIPREERKKLRMQRNKKMHEIKTWWYKMMIEPKFSFREKMTLFWHNHFVSEYKVVKSPYMMYKQNQLYRENSLGSFDELLHKSSQDLAMLIYLDNNSNKKSHPNENYARELLELFTLGEGNYSEEDIKEAARAFTGYRINKKKAIFKKIKKHHDNGIKTFMGNKGTFDGSDIIDIILKQEQTSKFITYKLYKEFVSENINYDEVNRLASIFRKSNYDISVLMKNILLSKDFWNNKSNMIKSPVEMMVSLIKNLNLKVKEKEYRFIIRYGKNLGQDLFNPPNVKGWISGEKWIDSTSLVTRKDFINKVIKRKLKKKKIKSLNINSFDEFSNHFLSFDSSNNKEVFKASREFYSLMLTKPIYQIK